jgi:ProP effector
MMQNKAQRRYARAISTLTTLVELFPRTFSFVRCQPLKICIDHDITTALGATRGALPDALRLYTNSDAYLRCLVAGADRVDLNGTPVGHVTDEEAGRARDRLAERFAARRAEEWAAAWAKRRADHSKHTARPTPNKSQLNEKPKLVEPAAAAHARKWSTLTLPATRSH